MMGLDSEGLLLKRPELAARQIYGVRTLVGQGLVRPVTEPITWPTVEHYARCRITSPLPTVLVVAYLISSQPPTLLS